MFFHADELRKFWESQDAGAESETDSILAADEEGLNHLHMQARTPARGLWMWQCALKGGDIATNALAVNTAVANPPGLRTVVWAVVSIWVFIAEACVWRSDGRSAKFCQVQLRNAASHLKDGCAGNTIQARMAARAASRLRWRRATWASSGHCQHLLHLLSREATNARAWSWGHSRLMLSRSMYASCTPAAPLARMHLHALA